MKRLFTRKCLPLLLCLLMVIGLAACSAAPAAQSQTTKTEDAGIEVIDKEDLKEAVTEAAEAIEEKFEEAEEESETDEQEAAEEAAEALEAEAGKADAGEADAKEAAPAIDENGSYNSKDEVALYIHTYGHLPSNYVTKKEAEKAGWSGGSLEKYFPGKSIGGSRFGNYEGLLPDKKGRTYTECDIDTAGKKSRGAKRIVFSNDGLIYYTGDHYKSFELLYGEE